MGPPVVRLIPSSMNFGKPALFPPTPIPASALGFLGIWSRNQSYCIVLVTRIMMYEPSFEGPGPSPHSRFRAPLPSRSLVPEIRVAHSILTAGKPSLNSLIPVQANGSFQGTRVIWSLWALSGGNGFVEVVSRDGASRTTLLLII